MAISLEPERPESLPAIRLPNVGDEVVGAIVNLELLDAIDPKTKAVKVNDQGRPRKKQIITVLITRVVGGALLGLGDQVGPAEVGKVGRIFVEGSTWKWWIEAKENHRIEVGDFVQWRFADTQHNPAAGQSDYKNRKFALRRALPAEADLVAKCEQLYRDMQVAADAVSTENTSGF